MSTIPIETIQLKGDVYIDHFDQYGVLKKSYHYYNLIVDTGKTYIASRICKGTATLMSYMAIGDDATSPDAGDLALGNELARIAMTSFDNTNNVVQAVCTFVAGVGTGAIVEAGIFNHATTGTMLNRVTFPVINKESGDSITITWNITIA